MKLINAAVTAAIAIWTLNPLFPAQEAKPNPLAVGVEQLRHTHGQWEVTTEFLQPDGSVRRTAEGTYTFDWVVKDRVLSGRSEIPAMGQTSGLLFYLKEKKGEIEMSSVGADGRLWVMTGPIDGEVRITPPVATEDGGTLQLRFTRYNVQPDGFESKMEYSTDGGQTWLPGNHQTFRRQK